MRSMRSVPLIRPPRGGLGLPGTYAGSPRDADIFGPWASSINCYARQLAASAGSIERMRQYYRRGEVLGRLSAASVRA